MGLSKSSPNVLPFLPEPRGRRRSGPEQLQGESLGRPLPGAPSPPRYAHRLPWASSPGDGAPCPASSPLEDRDPHPCLGHSPREQLGPSYRVGSSRQRPPTTQPLCPGRTGLGLRGGWWVKTPPPPPPALLKPLALTSRAWRLAAPQPGRPLSSPLCWPRSGGSSGTSHLTPPNFSPTPDPLFLKLCFHRTNHSRCIICFPDVIKDGWSCSDVPEH